ncbi:MAG: xanthine dehydrogenase family protein subunit M [Bacilli bacterium]
MEAKLYHLATSLEDAHKKLLENPRNVLLGGGLWVKKSTKSVETLIDLTALNLNEIVETEEDIQVGAMVSLRQFEKHPAIRAVYSGFLALATQQIMGVAFRQLATIGGTIAGRFAFSDLLTALVTIDVRLMFYPHKVVSLVDYLEAKGKTTDILTKVIIKKSPGTGYFKKVSNTTLDFAILNVAVLYTNNAYKIAVGARPQGASLAIKASEYLAKIAFPTAEDFANAAEIASEELKFLSTPTGSESYRKTLTCAYVRRGLIEVAKNAG